MNTLAEVRQHVAENGLYYYGWGAWHSLACRAFPYKNIEILSYLLESGLDVASNCTVCSPPCLRAMTEGARPDILRKLIEHGADPNAGDPGSGHTALHEAAMSNTSIYCQILLDAGASVNQCTKNGQTALHYAVLAERTTTARYLISRGADVNVRSNHFANTPLHAAIKRHYRSARMVRLLLEAGADANMQDDEGRNPVHHAMRNSNYNALLALVEHGADVNHVDKRGQHPLQEWRVAFYLPRGTLELLCAAGVVVNVLDTRNLTGMGEKNRILLHAALNSFTDNGSDDPAVREFEDRCYAIARQNMKGMVDVCKALQNLRLPTLVLCDIVLELYSCWVRVRFSDVWDRVATVRHFHERRAGARKE